MDATVLAQLMKTRLFQPGGKTTDLYVMGAVMLLGLATTMGWVTPDQVTAIHTVAPEVLGILVTLLGAWGYNGKRTKVKVAQAELLKVLAAAGVKVPEEGVVTNQVGELQVMEYLQTEAGKALLAKIIKSLPNSAQLK